MQNATRSQKAPIISIVIPTYQHVRDIGRCLESIYTQTYKDYEIVVVNDGSTDGTSEALAPHVASGRIRLIEKENGGDTRSAQAARNLGWKSAHPGSKYLLFCDADVVMRPDMLEKMAAALEAHPEAAYAYSSFKFGRKAFDLAR